MITSVKTCFKCGAEKPLTDFYKHAAMADGRVNKCKECNKADVRKNRKDKIDYYRQYDVNRFTTQPHRKELANSQCKKYRKKYPNKYKAHAAVHNALRSGVLKRSDKCECCDGTKNLHAHHDDYAKPLEVRWLCPVCHNAWHSKHGEALNGEINE